METTSFIIVFTNSPIFLLSFSNESSPQHLTLFLFKKNFHVIHLSPTLSFCLFLLIFSSRNIYPISPTRAISRYFIPLDLVTLTYLAKSTYYSALQYAIFSTLLLFPSSLFQVLHQYAVFQHLQPITYSKIVPSQYAISVSFCDNINMYC